MGVRSNYLERIVMIATKYVCLEHKKVFYEAGGCKECRLEKREIVNWTPLDEAVMVLLTDILSELKSLGENVRVKG